MENRNLEMHCVSLDEDAKVENLNQNVEEIKMLSFDESNRNCTNVVVQHEDLEEHDGSNVSNFLASGIQNVRNEIVKCGVHHQKILKTIFKVSIFILYNIYLFGAIYHSVENEITLDWCDGLGMLLILTAIVYWSLFYYIILKKYWRKRIQRSLTPVLAVITNITSKRFVPLIFFILALAGVLTFLVVDSRGDERRLVSLLGVIVILTILLFVSKHPGRIIWRQVMSGLALQLLVALAILRWEGGKNVTICISKKVTTFLHFGRTGSNFIYNYLSSGTANVTLIWDPNNAASSNLIKSNALIVLPGVFAFSLMTIIYFVGFVVSLLYHLGAMTWVVSKLGWILQVFIGTTAAESMNVASNIFLGLTEAPLVIKPYLSEMTRSELHAIMTGGFATIAGGSLAAYITFGIDARYLLSASVMAAPAALGLSKLVYPETKKSRTTADHLQQIRTKAEGNLLDAAAQGAIQGIIVIAGIIANVIAFISFITFVNSVISWLGMLVGADYLSFEWILGRMFTPLAWVMGVEWKECEDVALLIGLKVVVNEFVAYERLVTRMAHLSARSKIISTYALCSFANFSAIGIQLGAIGALAPNRRSDLVKTIWRAFITGVAVGFLNGCVAGMLISSND